jgi:hypothetical protein
VHPQAVPENVGEALCGDDELGERSKFEQQFVWLSLVEAEIDTGELQRVA